jgi:hypothetical protein
MTDLLLHVGLMKAGSTTLQERVFVHSPGNIGRPFAGSWAHGNVTGLREVVGLAGNDADLTAALRHWVTRLESAVPKRVLAQPLAILSDEVLTRPWFYFRTGVTPRYASDRLPIAHLVDVLANGGIWSHGRVRVLLSLRRQDAFLASFYAQQSDRIPFASQRDFERRVRYILENPTLRGAAYLDWSTHVEQLRDAVGADALTVVHLEELSHPYTLDQLSSLTGIERRLLPAGEVERANVRGSGANQWRLRRLRTPRKFKRTGKRQSYDVERPMLKQGLAWADRLLRGYERGQLALTTEVEATIARTVAPFNRRLEVLLERDLATLGYQTVEPRKPASA